MASARTRVEVDDMDTKLLIIAVAVVLVVVGVFVLLQGKPVPAGPAAPTSPNASATPTKMETPEDITAVHMAMDPNSLPGLEAVITGNGDNYTRERAVIAYADIALRTGNGQRAMDFLKNVAYVEQNQEVSSSAYANYYWLKSGMGIGPNATMGVSVSGSLKTGNNITVLVTVYSPRPASHLAKVSCGGVDTEPHNVTTGGGPDVGVVMNSSISGAGAFAHAWVLSPDTVKENITAMPVTVPFTVYLRESGKTIVKCHLEARYDRLDYDELEQWVYLDVGPDSGTYNITTPG
jgi:hypothetical protein